MKVVNPLLILLATTPLVRAAIIPKGISSLLTNSKVPTQEEVFVENGQKQSSGGGSTDSTDKTIVVDRNKQSEEVNGNSLDLQNVDLAALFNFQDQGSASVASASTSSSPGVKRTSKSRVSALEHYKDTFADFSTDYDNEKTSAILLSSRIIKNNTLKKLGIKGISFKLPVLGSGFPKMVNEPSFLPINTNSVFLFNLKESIRLDQTRLAGSIPLDIKGNFKIDDYNLLVPITYLQNLKVSSVFLEDFLVACDDQILYYNSPLEIDSPLLITVISKSEMKTSKPDSSSPSSSNPSSSKLSSLFFELISKNWLQSSAKSIDLLQSTFCFINNDEAKQSKKNNKSICLRLNDNEKSIDITPSFDADNKLNFNEIVPSPIPEKRQKRDTYPAYRNDTVASGGRPFKIQVGNNTLTGHDRVFKNITKCHEEEENHVPQQPLNGTLFGQTDLIGMQSFPHAPVLLLQARPANYKQIVDHTEANVEGNLSFL